MIPNLESFFVSQGNPMLKWSLRTVLRQNWNKISFWFKGQLRSPRDSCIQRVAISRPPKDLQSTQWWFWVLQHSLARGFQWVRLRVLAFLIRLWEVHMQSQVQDFWKWLRKGCAFGKRVDFWCVKRWIWVIFWLICFWGIWYGMAFFEFDFNIKVKIIRKWWEGNL